MPSIEPRQRFLAAGALGLFALVLMFVYPFAFEALRARLGVRGLAAASLLASAISLWLARRLAAPPRAHALAHALPALLLAALLAGSARLLALVPALVQLGVALVMLGSLRAPESLMFQAVRWLVPEAPDFLAPYCRKLTAVWGLFFAGSAALCGGLAVWGDHETWRFAAGPLVCTWALSLTALEFIVRKTWFRYYFRGGPFDRLWSRWFPAEATAVGRRSMEAIARYRASRLREAPELRDVPTAREAPAEPDAARAADALHYTARSHPSNRGGMR